MPLGSRSIPLVGILVGVSLLALSPVQPAARSLRRGTRAYRQRLAELTSFSLGPTGRARNRKLQVTRQPPRRRFGRLGRRYRRRHRRARRFVPPRPAPGVSDAVLVARLRNRILRLRRCFQRRYVTWTGSGTLHVRVALGPDGRVARLRVQTRDHGALADCVAARVGRWHLGRIGRRIVHSFTVTAGSRPVPVSRRSRGDGLFADHTP